MTHAGGRPSIYDKDIHPQMVIDYVNSCEDKNTKRVQMESTGEFGGSTAWQLNVEVNLPTFEGCAISLGVARSTLFEWEKNFEEFSDSLEFLKAEQAKRLINRGLSGHYKSPIAKLLLHNHGYAAETKTTISGSLEVRHRPDLSNLSDEQLQALADIAKSTNAAKES